MTDIPLAEEQANQSTTQASSHAVPENETEPSTSALPETSVTPQMEVPSTSANVEQVNDVLKILSPLPDASKRRLTVRKRRTQKSQILTSSPYKNELVEKMPKITKNMKNLLKKKNPTPKPRPEHQETECIICGETFDEDWIQCNKCQDWAHEACVDINPSDLYYNCDVCVAKKRFRH